MRKRKSLELIFIIIVLYASSSFVCYADTIFDPFGDSISMDIVSSSGGQYLQDLSGNTINASLGQCTVGVSVNSAGATLYHGVHKPKLAVVPSNQWMLY